VGFLRSQPTNHHTVFPRPDEEKSKQAATRQAMGLSVLDMTASHNMAAAHLYRLPEHNDTTTQQQQQQ